MEEHQDAAKRLYKKRSLQCRLCLREYDKNQLVEIFGKDRDYKNRIFDAVSVKPLRQDLLTRVCVICNDIVQLITNFRTACQQADSLLRNEICVPKSNTRPSSESSNVFHQATLLVEKHQKEIEKIFYREKETSIKLEPKDDDIVKEGFGIDLEEDDLRLNDADVLEQKSVIECDSKSENNQYSELDVNLEVETSDLEFKDENAIKVGTSRKSRSSKKSQNSKESREKVVCSTCGELVSQNGLEGHMNRHLGIQPFICDVEGCEAKLYSKFALQQHRSRHKSTNRFYDCETCGKRIKGTAYWLIHRKMHIEEPKFSCDICGKKFRRKCKLKLHSTVHTGIAEFPCEICGKYFTVKHNLTAHYKLHMKHGTCPLGFEPSNVVEDGKIRQEQC